MDFEKRIIMKVHEPKLNLPLQLIPATIGFTKLSECKKTLITHASVYPVNFFPFFFVIGCPSSSTMKSSISVEIKIKGLLKKL